MTQLPQLDAPLFLTDGGAETTLIFDDGIDLPDFAAFPLLDDPDGHATLTRYFERYAGIAERDGAGIVLETATWRANPDWAARLGYDVEQLASANRKGVDLLLDVRQRFAIPVVISGCVGPRGDAYRPESIMTREEARDYHSTQIRTFADTPADLVTAMTLTNVPEATGIVDAAREANVPVVISFTVETDGRLPSGDALGDAIEAVDRDTNGYPAYYMVNCAHPTHIAPALDPEAAWTHRLQGIRANASKLSHAELDEAEALDRGDPEELADDYRALRARFPRLTVLGGCCGTDHRHIDAISRAFSG
ncbi:Homocysteine/selenocysteine methylase (S-methylmethionine-dependent) [Lentzea waywayandensis]|uniref:Homocysteine/selenocysteine methylase (S-methylmethionine-dependent) n=1 Tax=Lentzea waywayandensis TaxID=84724 RepID=A0A1I6FFP1_9PSEU|nr:homocysteine S-methyltransferase family protein [Lentzea waywayandensis]SFR28765.1 Homocysteine/selenocysteine methylase (S-methylmethionine-dependent) [Lentzea waywayandensis]